MAKGERLHFVVITPERKVLEDSADFVAFTGHDGEIGILPKRAPLMCALGIGEFRYETGGRTQRLFLDGGFAQVLDNEITVLSPRAVPVEMITPEMVSAAEKAADEAQGSDPDAVEARRKAEARARALRHLQTAK